MHSCCTNIAKQMTKSKCLF